MSYRPFHFDSAIPRSDMIPLMSQPSPLPPALCIALATAMALAQPSFTPYPGTDAPHLSAVASAALGGLSAVANTRTDTIEARDADGVIAFTLSRGRLNAVAPWMNFTTDADGPTALCFSDSGRLLYIVLCATAAAPDSQPGDAILRYDTFTDALSIYLRAELGGLQLTPRPTMQHFRGRLYVGAPGRVTCYSASSTALTGSAIFNITIGNVSVTNALAIDRQASTIYVASGNALARAPIGSGSLSFSAVGTLAAPAAALAWSDHYGGPGQAGLYVAHHYASTIPPGAALVSYITPARARGTATFAAPPYVVAQPGDQVPQAMIETSNGRLLLTSPSQARYLADASDTRLSFAQWKVDEFAQVVRFAKGLISPDGEPAGWVIDADVIPAWSRFHPATPDGAAWVVLILLMNDHLYADPAAQPLVRTILNRYAGLAPDGIVPSRTADGIFRHWINPANGNAKPGWDPEFATLSTMKIVLAAARARAFYPTDSSIRIAANAIICGVRNWDNYFDFSGRTYFTALAGGNKDASSLTTGWHESVIFAEQAGVYGSTTGPFNSNYWLTRTNWPQSISIPGRGVTSNSSGSFLPAFIPLYAQLTIDSFRQSPSWQTNMLNLRLSHAAWTDDNGPRYFTVFSAGTTKSIWGGYNADNLTNHPGNISTFTSLLAMSANTGTGAGPAPAASAYHAYRNGARQTFKSGASILYRRSQVDPAYSPDSAGLPDVALGALGLAQLIQPGSIERVLTGGYPSCAGNLGCPSDWNQDGGVDGSDVDAFFTDWVQGQADISEDGGTDGADVERFFIFWQSGC